MTGDTSARHWLDPPDWWRKHRPLRRLAAAAVSVALVLGLHTLFHAFSTPAIHPRTAEFTARVSDPVVLIGALRSFQRVKDVTTRLRHEGYKYGVAADHTPPSPQWPPRNLDTVTVRKYRHLGATGKLTLSFFNDRLFEADFVPDNPGRYARRLHAALPKLRRGPSGHAEWVKGSLRIATNVDVAASPVGRALHLTPFAVWQDLRLVHQLDRWDRDFGGPLVSAQGR